MNILIAGDGALDPERVKKSLQDALDKLMSAFSPLWQDLIEQAKRIIADIAEIMWTEETKKYKPVKSLVPFYQNPVYPVRFRARSNC